MRFDVKCRDCAFFRSEAVPQAIDCANADGSVWDPKERACDNFSHKKKETIKGKDIKKGMTKAVSAKITKKAVRKKTAG